MRQTTGKDWFGLMRAALRPRGSLDVVRLQLGESGFMDGAAVRDAIDHLEKRMLSVAIEPLNPLERLAARLLMESANGGISEGRNERGGLF